MPKITHEKWFQTDLLAIHKFDWVFGHNFLPKSWPTFITQTGFLKLIQSIRLYFLLFFSFGILVFPFQMDVIIHCKKEAEKAWKNIGCGDWSTTEPTSTGSNYKVRIEKKEITDLNKT